MLRPALIALLFAACSPLCSLAAEPELNATETAMVAQLNEFRAGHGLPALKPAGWLMERARSHTRWMLQNGMVHSSGVAENIAMGQGSVRSVMQAWIGSSGHRSNMLGAHAFVGVSGYTSPGGTPFWTQQFSGSANGSPEAVEGGSGGRSITAPFRFFRRFRR